MKVTPYLKEGIFKTPESPIVQVIEEYFEPAIIKEGPFVYCLYIEREGIVWVINCVLMTDAEPVGFMDSFVNYLHYHRPDNFKDILFLLDMYNQMLLPDKLSGDADLLSLPLLKKDKGSSQSEVLESFVEDSRGYLIWHHQIENILGLYFRVREQAAKFRKELNARKAEAWNRLREFRGGELHDFINARMIFGGTKKPNISGAATLYALFRSA